MLDKTGLVDKTENLALWLCLRRYMVETLKITSRQAACRFPVSRNSVNELILQGLFFKDFT